MWINVTLKPGVFASLKVFAWGVGMLQNKIRCTRMDDDESKKYTTINTSKGLFHYDEQLPFGVSSAPSIFQK